MSFLMLSASRRAGVAAPTVPEDAIDVVVQRFDGGSGSVLVSSAIPLPPSGPGSMTVSDVAANKGVVKIGGTEYARHLSATKARHQNGNVASVLVQLTVTIPDDEPIVGTFTAQQVAADDSLTLTTVTRAMAAGSAAILPSSAGYLCTTDCTLQPLIPATEFTAAETAWFVTWFASVQDSMDYAWTNRATVPWPAFYQVGRAFLSHWCVTGDASSWWKGMRIIDYWFHLYNHISPAEQYSMVYLDVGIGYLLSAFEDFWTRTGQTTMAYGGTGGGNGLMYASQEAALLPTYSVPLATNGALGSSAGIRANLRHMWSALAAHRIDAKSASFRSPVSVFATQWSWRIDALEEHAYDLGDYRDGMVGQTDAYNSGGELPTFWLSIVNAFMRDYWHNVHADSRIPAMIKVNVDVMLSQVNPIASGVNYNNGSRHGIPYAMDATEAPGAGADPVLFTMFAADLAFLSRHYPSDVVNGAEYLTWYERAICPGNIDEANNLNYNHWKTFGEGMGWTFSGPFHRAGTSYTPPATIREPETY